jgi:ArsR family transcriptional regulator, cadmium/lead-responsive transcriptional repressor
MTRDVFEALADPTRREVVRRLAEGGPATATELAGELPVTRQAVAKHLAVLDRAGLVEGRRNGREVHYTVRPERLDEAVRVMAGVTAQWERRLRVIKVRLEAIKRAAEAAHRESQAD